MLSFLEIKNSSNSSKNTAQELIQFIFKKMWSGLKKDGTRLS